MTSVTEGHAVGVESSSHTDDLVSHADTEDGLVPLCDGAAEVESSLHALLWVSRAVGQEETIELVPDLVEVEVPGKDGDSSTAADERASDVGLGAKVEKRNLDVAGGVELVWLLGRDLVDEVLQGGIPVLVCSGSREGGISADGESAESGSLVTKQGGDGTGIDTGDSRDVVTLAPRGDGLDGGVVGVLLGDVANDDSGTLDALGLEDNADVLRIARSFVVGNTVVADHGGREDQNLPSVRGVGHRLSV